MKNIVLALSVAALLASCTKDKPKGNLHITGEVKGLKAGTLYIRKMNDSAMVNLDTIKIDGDSHFSSDLDIKSPEMFYLVLDRGATNSIDDNLPFFAEPGNIKIETTLKAFYSQAKITGSKNQELYEQFHKATARYTNENTNIIGEQIRAQRLGKLTRLDSLYTAQKLNMGKRYLYTVNFALNNRDHEVAPFVVLSEINNVNLKYLDTIQKSLSPKVAQSFYGKKLKAFYEERKKLEQ